MVFVMVHCKNKKYGFTLIEISISIAIFALIMGMAYKVFSGASFGLQRSTKSLKMQNEMRNGLTFIREEMQRASYESHIAINGNTLDESRKFSLTKDAEIDGKTNKKLAEWFICKPFIAAEPGTGVVFKCTLKLSDNKIYYTKTVDKGADASEHLYNNKVVMTQVGTIKISTEEYTAGSSNKGALIEIETFAVGSTKGQSDLTVSAQTGAKVEVEVVRNL